MAINARIERVGIAQTPIICIDDFSEHLAPILTDARQQAFTTDNHSLYPGIRAKLPKSYVVDVLNATYQLIYQTYQIPHQLRLKPQDIYYSLITKNASQLQPLQCLPHFDSNAPYYFAILHYLNPEPHGGTLFFRHNRTQLERIDSTSQAHYFEQCQPQITSQTKTYVDETNPHYQCYKKVNYQTNRLLIYPGNLLHSAQVKCGLDIDSNVNTGRLTANIFINFQ